MVSIAIVLDDLQYSSSMYLFFQSPFSSWFVTVPAALRISFDTLISDREETEKLTDTVYDQRWLIATCQRTQWCYHIRRSLCPICNCSGRLYTAKSYFNNGLVTGVAICHIVMTREQCLNSTGCSSWLSKYRDLEIMSHVKGP